MCFLFKALYLDRVECHELPYGRRYPMMKGMTDKYVRKREVLELQLCGIPKQKKKSFQRNQVLVLT